jgi:hypothetical protein
MEGNSRAFTRSKHRKRKDYTENPVFLRGENFLILFCPCLSARYTETKTGYILSSKAEVFSKFGENFEKRPSFFYYKEIP